MGVVLLFCFIAIFITPSFGDETRYHYPLARNISLNQIMDPHSDYSSTYMPLPYLIANAFLKMFPSLYTVRFLNYAIFLLLIYFFYLLARKFSHDPWLLTLLAFLNPYFLMSSFVFYMYNWGPLFALLGLYFYSVKKSLPLAGLFLSFAVLSQQWMLMLAVAIMLYEGIQLIQGEITLGLFSKRALTIFIFLTPAIFLFVNWQGLVHPNFVSHALRPSFEHLSAVLSHFGFIMFFPVISVSFSFINKKHIPLILLLPWFWLSIPAFSSYSDLNHITGFFPHLAMKFDQYLGLPYQVTMFLFIIPGILSLAMLMKKTNYEETDFLAYGALGLFTAFVASARLASAHIYIALPFLLLLFHNEISGLKKLKVLMIAQYLVISVVLILYFTFFRSRGILF